VFRFKNYKQHKTNLHSHEIFFEQSSKKYNASGIFININSGR